MSRVCSITKAKPTQGSIIHRRGLAKKKGGIGQHVTKVVPRTVRAYCTQPVKEIDKINTPNASDSCALGNKARPTPAISKATKMAGKESITSHKRIRKTSIQPPRKPASKPMATPNTTGRHHRSQPHHQ